MGSSETETGSRDEILARISTGIAPASGAEFFPLLVHHVARGLGASCAMVGELRSPYDGTLTSVTADIRGKLVGNFVYRLEESPFEHLIAGQPFVYARGVRDAFPKDPFLAEMKFESCAAIPLLDSEGGTVGVLAVMREDADPAPDLTLAVLGFLASRIGAEIERARTEEALRFTQFAVDRGSDASFWMGPDGRFIYVNAAACRSLGYTREELCAMSVADIDPFYNAAFWPSAWERVRNERTYTFESIHRRKDGSTFPVEIRVNYLEFAGREYNCAFATDITERTRTEALVAGQSRVLELIAEAKPLEKTLEELTRVIEGQAPDAVSLICLLDESRCNLAPVAGPSIPDSFKQAIAQMPVGEGEGACAAAAHRKTLVVVEDVTTDPLSGKHRDLLLGHGLSACWSAPILSSTGKVLGTFALFYRERRRPVGEEIALIETASHLARIAIERKQDEESLRLLGERFRRLIERMPEGILVHRFGPIVYANPRAATALGYSRPDDLIGKSVLDLVEPGRRKGVQEQLRRIRETREPVPAGEMRVIRKDGRTTSAELETLPIDFDGEPAVITIARDVRDRKRMQARLLQADRMASVGTLAAGVAHEINNPLAYVISNLDYLLREMPSILKAVSEAGGRESHGGSGGASEELSEHLSEIEATVQDAREGAERVRQIVRDLRTFSRDGDGELCPVDVHRILESSINMARREIEKRGKLVLSLEPVPPVQGNESRLGQVFLNLLLNAAQALPEDRIEGNEIRVRTSLAKPDRVLIEVEDSGVGIPPENMDQIFQPFFTTKPVGIGTGLGLSICQNIVTALGGEISVKSSVGRYSRFSLLLPAAVVLGGDPDASDEDGDPERSAASA